MAKSAIMPLETKKLPAVVTDKVGILWRHMGREHDFLVGDFGFIGIVFLFLVVFREQLLAALVGGGRNSRFVFTPLDDGDFTVRAWQVCALLSPGFRAKK